jgi:hypothetical protein
MTKNTASVIAHLRYDLSFHAGLICKGNISPGSFSLSLCSGKGRSRTLDLGIDEPSVLTIDISLK